MRNYKESKDGWKKWFAWYPIYVKLEKGGVWIWFETIERYSTLNACGDPHYYCRNLDGSEIKAKPKNNDQLVD